MGMAWRELRTWGAWAMFSADRSREQQLIFHLRNFIGPLRRALFLWRDCIWRALF